MKKLLIIILAFIAIKSEAQIPTFYQLKASDVTFGSGTWGYNSNIISKDTTIIDTTRVDFLVIDTVNESWHGYSDINYIRGYRVDIRKGEYSNSMGPTSCPEGILGCLVAHYKVEYIRPRVIKSYYISSRKLKISDEFIVKELP